MENRDAEQRQAKQYEIDRDSEQVDGPCGVDVSHWAHAFCVGGPTIVDLSLLHAANTRSRSTQQRKEGNLIRRAALWFHTVPAISELGRCR